MEAARAQNRSSVNYVNFQIQLLKLPCRKLMFFVSRSRRMTRIQLIIILFFVGVVVDEAMVHMSTCSRSGWVFCPAEVIQYDRSNDRSSNLLLFTFAQFYEPVTSLYVPPLLLSCRLYHQSIAVVPSRRGGVTRRVMFSVCWCYNVIGRRIFFVIYVTAIRI